MTIWYRYSEETRALIHRMALQGVCLREIALATEKTATPMTTKAISGARPYREGKAERLNHPTPEPSPEPVKDHVQYGRMVIRKATQRTGIEGEWIPPVSISAGVEWVA